MSNIFVIDKKTKESLGVIDFLPRREERLVLSGLTGRIECIVHYVMYYPSEQGTLVFVDVVEPYYSKMISEIKW